MACDNLQKVKSVSRRVENKVEAASKDQKVTYDLFNGSKFQYPYSSSKSESNIKQKPSQKYAVDGTTKIGSLLSVQVLKVDSPDHIRFMSIENLAHRSLLMTRMNEHYRKLTGTISYVDSCLEGKLYALMVVRGNVSNWYRVRVNAVTNAAMNVFLIDYGTCTTRRDLTDFRLLAPQFAKKPDLVWYGKLTGVAPKRSSNYEWPAPVIEKLNSMLAGKKVFCHVAGVVEYPGLNCQSLMLVGLCDTTDGSRDVWINDMLVEKWKVARYI